MKFDYIEEARAIAEGLRSEGKEDEATSVTNAIESGFTGTEIMMGINSVLKQQMREGLQVAKDLRGKIVRLVQYMTETLSS